MKKILLLALFVIFSISFISCDDSTTDPIEEEKGNLIVNSTPSGAKIFLDGTDSGFLTPYTFAEKAVGTYSVTLKLSSYADTTINAQVVTSQTATLNVTLKPTYSVFGPVEFWESLDPSATHPSGLSLKLGKAFSISASNDSSIYNDVYYNSDGFIVVSSKGRNSMTRETYFKIGTSTNLNDGVDSPTKDNTWVKSISVAERNYVFLYDQDGNYSKFQITQENGGQPGVFASVVVKWIYNKVKDNKSF
ncbi:MAG: PEGA domain-containing protein [Ignavibacteriae bacterium]|nr:PEGA domain-containing protein [Ignavibacteriota bacterium]